MIFRGKYVYLTCFLLKHDQLRFDALLRNYLVIEGCFNNVCSECFSAIFTFSSGVPLNGLFMLDSDSVILFRCFILLNAIVNHWCYCLCHHIFSNTICIWQSSNLAWWNETKQYYYWTWCMFHFKFHAKLNHLNNILPTL